MLSVIEMLPHPIRKDKTTNALQSAGVTDDVPKYSKSGGVSETRHEVSYRFSRFINDYFHELYLERIPVVVRNKEDLVLCKVLVNLHYSTIV